MWWGCHPPDVREVVYRVAISHEGIAAFRILQLTSVDIPPRLM